MFFLLRMVFWLTLVFALLPSGGSKPGAAMPGVEAACEQAGIRKSHDLARSAPRQTRSSATTAAARSPAANPSQGTLTAADLAPAWRGPRSDRHRKRGA